jgi:ABC-2 type transport system permease protein
MTTATLSPRAATRPAKGYGPRSVTRMEWNKLRTVRSTWYLTAIFAAGMISIAMLGMSHVAWAQMSGPDKASFDPTNDLLAGLALGQLVLGILGVLAISSEFSSGMIRATFTAVPNRQLVLAAKAAVLGALTLTAGEILSFAAFFAGQALLKAPAPQATLGQPGVLRAVLMGGAYPALIALIGLGLGSIIRHTAGAICAVVGVVFVLPLLTVPMGASVADAVQKFLPMEMAENTLTAVKPVAHQLSPGIAFGLLCCYALTVLVAGGWALARRDA